MSNRIGFLGAGNMGGALASGFVQTELARGADTLLFDILPEKAAEIARRIGGRTAASVRETLAGADVIVLAVKPQNLDEIAPEIAAAAEPRHLFISILAGASTQRIEAAFGGRPRVVRVMPNTPSLVGLGASALARGRHASDEDLALAIELFRAVGVAVAVEEKQLDAVTGLSGSGPAYFYYLIEALIDAGEQVGLDRETAAALTLQTALGAARLAMDSEDPPAVLRERVTSKGGTTAAGLAVLRDGGFAKLIAECVRAATARSAELGKG